jgi:hypothetical protein
VSSVLDALALIGATLTRLDRRSHATPARVELSQDDGQWTAMIMADPLRQPLCATGHSPAAAVQELADAIVERKRRR